jgi:hypothetical protein
MSDNPTSPPYEALDRTSLERERSAARKAARSCKDWVWIVIWLVHLGLVAWLAAAFAPELLTDGLEDVREREANTTMDEEVARAIGDAAKRAWPYLLIGLAVSLGWAVVWIAIVQRFAHRLIITALITTPVTFFILSILPGGSNTARVVTVLMCVVTAVYAYWILTSQRFRVEFARLTLVHVAEIVRRHVSCRARHSRVAPCAVVDAPPASRVHACP